MCRALLVVLFFAGVSIVAAAQHSTTIASDPGDLSRPISTLIDRMRQRENISITYEDPRYGNAADIEDVTAEASKGSDLEKAYGPHILVPKGRAITFVYASADVGSTAAAKATINRNVARICVTRRPGLHREKGRDALPCLSEGGSKRNGRRG
jgi:hypothetical protein